MPDVIFADADLFTPLLLLASIDAATLRRMIRRMPPPLRCLRCRRLIFAFALMLTRRYAISGLQR